MNKNLMKLWYACLVQLLLMTAVSAQSSKDQYEFNYDLSKPEVIELPDEISQISGIAYDQKDQSVYAVDDDYGNVYKVPLQKNPKIEKWSFGKAADYEDIVLINNHMYVLNSKGKIVSFPVNFPIQKTDEVSLDIKGRNEFEILFKDPQSNNLLMICKNCSNDNKNELSVYPYNLSTKTFDKDSVKTLNVKDIEEKSGETIGHFRPSAANVNPRTGEIYILSSVNKLLVITDKNLSIKKAIKLDPDIYKQPEGLAFTPSGDMLISNEFAHKGKANILILRNRMQPQKE